jgi:hypothetical protein
MISNESEEKQSDKVTKLESEIQEMKLVISTLMKSKPGYGNLNKKRGKEVRIAHIPVKLNERIEKVEADEKMHSIYKKKGEQGKLVQKAVPLIY